MVFSTIIFLFRFLPITLALYYLAPAKLKNTVLFLCSLVFYCWGEVRFFPVMVALILINYLCGLGLEKCAAKPAARTAFVMRYYYGDPLTRIAAAHGTTVSQVKSLLHRTRKALFTHLQEEGLLS